MPVCFLTTALFPLRGILGGEWEVQTAWGETERTVPYAAFQHWGISSMLGTLVSDPPWPFPSYLLNELNSQGNKGRRFGLVKRRGSLYCKG